MRKQDAIEIAHQIAELLKARKLRDLLTTGTQAHMPLEPVLITLQDPGGAVIHNVEIPPHVLRHVAESGVLKYACENVIQRHEQALLEMAGITIEEDAQ